MWWSCWAQATQATSSEARLSPSHVRNLSLPLPPPVPRPAAEMREAACEQSSPSSLLCACPFPPQVAACSTAAVRDPLSSRHSLWRGRPSAHLTTRMGMMETGIGRRLPAALRGD